MDAVWPDTFVTESSLLEAIGLLRDALGDDRKQPTYIQTVHRRGYRFIGQIIGIGIGCTKCTGCAQRCNACRSRWRPILSRAPPMSITTMCVAIVFAVFGQHPIERRTSRFSISLPGNARSIRCADRLRSRLTDRDWRYVATAAGRSQLFLRSVDRDEPVAIAGTEDASDPFFSPDGEWIGFFARGSLQKVRVDGGLPIVLSAARARRGRHVDRRQHHRLRRRSRRRPGTRQRGGRQRDRSARRTMRRS